MYQHVMRAEICMPGLYTLAMNARLYLHHHRQLWKANRSLVAVPNVCIYKYIYGGRNLASLKLIACMQGLKNSAFNSTVMFSPKQWHHDL